MLLSYLCICLSSFISLFLPLTFWLTLNRMLSWASLCTSCGLPLLIGWLDIPSCFSIIPAPFSSFSSDHCSVMSDSLQPHELQHSSPPCPSPTPRVHPKQCPLSRWCHPTISSYIVPFSSCLQSFPASGSFQMSQLFTSGGQNIGVWASTSVLPMNTQDRSPLGWPGWISLQSRGLKSQESSPTPQFKSINSPVLSFLYSPSLTSIHDYWKNHHCLD